MSGSNGTERTQWKRNQDNRLRRFDIDQSHTQVAIEASAETRGLQEARGPYRRYYSEPGNTEERESDQEDWCEQGSAANTTEHCYAGDSDADREHKPIDRPVHASPPFVGLHSAALHGSSILPEPEE